MTLKDSPMSDDCFSLVSNCYHLIISVMLVKVHRHVSMYVDVYVCMKICVSV